MELKLDFEKKIYNSNKFRGPALHFKQFGVYTFSPKGTTEYMNYWRDQAKKCVDGFESEDGDWISGYHYFYLNFCKIDRVVEIEREVKGEKIISKIKKIEFPDFYDYDYYFFTMVELAEINNKHCVVLKSRRKGYSYKCGAMLCRNFYLIPGSKSYAYAAEKEFLIKDGILTKAWSYMSFIDQYTAWGKRRDVKNDTMHKRASYVEKDELGNSIEKGYNSEIIGVTIKNDAQKVRGKAAKLILFEEAGKSPNLLEAWETARPSVEQDGVSFGLMIAFGTGGTEGADFTGLRALFKSPGEHGVYSMPNIWEKGTEGSEVGFFVPQYANVDIREGDKICMDDDGNTITKNAVEYILNLRENEVGGASDSVSVDRYIAEHCITPSESMLELTGNIFPKKELQEQLNRVRFSTKLKSSKQIGDLLWDSGGGLNWKIKQSGDITEYPLPKTLDHKGSIVIWEHPCPDPPYGLYIAGCDPYDQDQSGTNSLGSVFIYKRFQNFESYYDIIVAEYTGRPDFAEEYYENVRKLLTYYRATLLYENERMGLFPYFTSKDCDYMLADQPDIISDIIGDSKVNRRKGIHMTEEIKRYGIGLIKEWLNYEVSPGIKNLTNIMSEPLLEELIMYNDKGNFDRVIALIMVMIYKLQLNRIVVKKTHEEEKKLRLFDSPILGNGWFDKELQPSSSIFS